MINRNAAQNMARAMMHVAGQPKFVSSGYKLGIVASLDPLTVQLSENVVADDELEYEPWILYDNYLLAITGFSGITAQYELVKVSEAEVISHIRQVLLSSILRGHGYDIPHQSEILGVNTFSVSIQVQPLYVTDILNENINTYIGPQRSIVNVETLNEYLSGDIITSIVVERIANVQVGDLVRLMSFNKGDKYVVYDIRKRG